VSPTEDGHTRLVRLRLLAPDVGGGTVREPRSAVRRWVTVMAEIRRSGVFLATELPADTE
jgi:hypothetical protein